MILLCPPEKSTQFHYPLDPKKIRAEGSVHKDTTYQGSHRQDFYRHGRKKINNTEQMPSIFRLGLPYGNPVKNTQSKCTQHNGQGNGKNVFSLTSKHKIINCLTRHASLSNDITHQNTSFHWSLLKSPGNLTLHYVALHYTFHTTIENFSACCNTSRGIKLAASQAWRLRSACSLAIINVSCAI